MARLNFERRLERLVAGAVNKTFRGGLQPVELGRRLVREMEGAVQIGIRGPVAPNRFDVELSADDAQRFSTFRDALCLELADSAREHAKEYDYHFVGSVAVEIHEAPSRRQGDFHISATIVASDLRLIATLRLSDGTRLPLDGKIATLGRMPDCTVQLTDPKSSRYHAEIRPVDAGYVLNDLQSTNGTLVNGTVTTSIALSHGDEIRIGESLIHFEEN